MINIFQTIKISLRKVKFNKPKSIFIILPISLMFALLFIASSEALSLINVTEKSIFSSIESQNETIELNKNGTTQGGPGGMRTFSFSSDSEDQSYTNSDVSTIESLENVEQANLVTETPVENVKTSDLFEGLNIELNGLAGLDSEYANLYTDESFEYSEGEAIPIILNANDFIENYQDWQGKDEIVIDLSKLRNSGPPEDGTDPIADQNPNKTKSVSYTKEDLIGKEITVTVGGLDELQNYTQEPSSNGLTFKKKTAETLATEETTRKDEISKYWDYSKISTPLTYTFKIVGIAEGSDKTKTYIPTAFADKLLKDYIQNEISARNTTAIATEDLNSKFQGLVFDGVSLKDDSLSALFSGIKRQVGGQLKQPPASGSFSVQSAPQNIKIGLPDESTSYKIPGFVLNKDRTTEEITGEYRSFDMAKQIPLDSTTILVKINSIDSRDQVIDALNEKGYFYQDFSKYKEFEQLETYLYTGLNIASIIFMIVTALFILINMARFVSESRKEIGIFRAIGATRMDIRSIFIIQSLLYIIIAIILGIVIGLIGVLGLSNLMLGSAQQFINTTIGEILPLTGDINQMDFINFNYQTIGIYTGILLIVTLIVSLWPAEQAAKVSPVEAIRN
jgi:ABC-type antimicrobial peptide transport system permease subunit